MLEKEKSSCIAAVFYFLFFLQHWTKLHGGNPPLRRPREQVASPLAAKIPINFRCSWQKRTLRTRTVITLSCWRHSQGEAAQGPKRTRGGGDEKKKKAQKTKIPAVKISERLRERFDLENLNMQSQRSPAPAVWNSFSVGGNHGVTLWSHCIRGWKPSRTPPIKGTRRVEGGRGGWGIDGATFRSWMFLLRAIFYASLHHRPGVRGAPAHRPLVMSSYTCRTSRRYPGEMTTGGN